MWCTRGQLLLIAWEAGLTSNDARPMYRRLADDLRNQIANGTLGVGSELPSTARLMETYGVSITVVRAAVRELRSEGIVIGQPGKAVYVQQVPEPASPTNDYEEIKQQVAGLRSALEDAVQELDQRMSRLEERAEQDR